MKIIKLPTKDDKKFALKCGAKFKCNYRFSMSFETYI